MSEYIIYFRYMDFLGYLAIPAKRIYSYLSEIEF